MPFLAIHPHACDSCLPVMLKIDLHIHSLNSGHAYGTVQEIISEALKKNMQLIAITDHGPSMHGILSRIHFGMGFRAPKQVEGLHILWGCESNVIDEEGNIDLDERKQDKLDIILMGFHTNTEYRDLGRKRNTKAVQRALTNPRIKVLTHPLHPQFDCDTTAIIETAIEHDVLLELNCAYTNREFGKLDEVKRMVELARSSKKKLIANSDAHFVHEIGDDSTLREVWDEIGMSDDMLINNYPDELNAFLGI